MKTIGRKIVMCRFLITEHISISIAQRFELLNLRIRMCTRELPIFFSIFYLCFMVTTETSGSVRAESSSKYCLVLNIWSFRFYEHFMVCSAQIIDFSFNGGVLRLSSSLIAHLIRRFKQAFLLTCCPSSARLLLNLLDFLLFL